MKRLLKVSTNKKYLIIGIVVLISFAMRSFASEKEVRRIKPMSIRLYNAKTGDFERKDTLVKTREEWKKSLEFYQYHVVGRPLPNRWRKKTWITMWTIVFLSAGWRSFALDAVLIWDTSSATDLLRQESDIALTPRLFLFCRTKNRPR